MYADDITIYHKVNNKKDYNNFQKDLAAVREWAHKWQMNINIDKCKVLHFGNKMKIKLTIYIMLKLQPQNVKKYSEYTLIRIVILNNISFILLKKLD